VTSPGQELFGYQTRIDLNANNFEFSKARVDGADVRFALGETDTSVPFWIEKWTEGSATIWVRLPRIPVGGTVLRMYYGNPTAQAASDGEGTFEFFDDFSTTDSVEGYFPLGEPETVLSTTLPWESSAPHTMSVIEPGFQGQPRYWGYYGLQGCGGLIGLATSDDLNTWNKSVAPLPFSSPGDRWPSVLVESGTIYMAHTVDYCGASHIILRRSSNGSDFRDGAPVSLVAQEAGVMNQNPALFKDPVTGRFYLYWFRGNKVIWEIRVKSAETLEGLTSSPSSVMLEAPSVLAAPQVMYYQGTYFLAVETLEGEWATRIYTSEIPDGGYRESAGNPILDKGSACFFQHIIGGEVHAYYCKQTGSTWTLDHRAGALSGGRQTVAGRPSAARWRPTGGRFSLGTSTGPDGTFVPSLRGSATRNELLLSTFSGSEYVADVFGRQVNGRVWGVGVSSSDSSNLVSVGLFGNLNGASNLYVHEWSNANGVTAATELARASAGTVDPLTWYKLTVKVSGASIAVAVNDRPVLQAVSSRCSAGRLALYGGAGSSFEIARVRVRKYSEVEPGVSMGSETAFF
jgi:hypothetical protein